MDDRSYHDAPTAPAGFLERLKAFDPLLSVQWSPWEIAGVKRPHWVVMRRVPSREKGYLERNGLLLREELCEERVEKVLTWTDAEGRMRPLDNRLMEHLAERDPSRYHANRLEGYKRMMGAMHARTAKERKERDAEAAAETVDEVICKASVPQGRATQGHFMGADLERTG